MDPGKCLPDARPEAAPASAHRPIDADEAFILDVIGRYAVPPSSTAAFPEH